MILGHVRDGFPRITLILPGHAGPIRVEFIVDTGFDGDLAVPARILAALQVTFVADRPMLMADGRLVRRPTYALILEWDEQPRSTEVIELDNAPLIGVQLMDGKFLQSEMTDGGEVSLDDM